jgi:penicillin-binding protein 1A
METALRNLPITEPTPAEGLVQMGGDWVYSEFAGGNGISSLGNKDNSSQADAMPPDEERKRILDLFRN